MTDFKRTDPCLLQAATTLAQPCPAQDDVTPAVVAAAASVSRGDWLWSLLLGHLRRGLDWCDELIAEVVCLISPSSRPNKAWVTNIVREVGAKLERADYPWAGPILFEAISAAGIPLDDEAAGILELVPTPAADLATELVLGPCNNDERYDGRVAECVNKVEVEAQRDDCIAPLVEWATFALALRKALVPPSKAPNAQQGRNRVNEGDSRTIQQREREDRLLARIQELESKVAKLTAVLEHPLVEAALKLEGESKRKDAVGFTIFRESQNVFYREMLSKKGGSATLYYGEPRLN